MQLRLRRVDIKSCSWLAI